MASCDQNTKESVTINWTIENCHFCWHKTGEKLESPLFNTNFSIQTSWRLWFYPRGEDDAEYVSVYLFREEGGPEVVDIDFQLFADIDYSHDIIINWYSFKIHQREGIKCFARRWKVFPSMADPQSRCYLCLGCKIFNRKGDSYRSSIQYLYTEIGIGSIQGVEIFDNITDINSPSNNVIDVISLLDDNPLININLSCTEDSLVIKILPVNSRKIKYALCRITIIKSWVEEPSIEHVRSWIGEIEADIWRYRELFKSMQTFNNKALFVKYDFKFSTGKKMEKCESQYSSYDSLQPYLCIKPAKSAPTALDALKENYTSKSFVDVYIKTESKTYPAHKAILCARSAICRSIIGENSREVEFPNCRYLKGYEDFFLFLYTDTLKLTKLHEIMHLYVLSIKIDLKLLNLLCRNVHLNHLNCQNAFTRFFLYTLFQDSLLETTVKNFIIAHYDFVIQGIKWERLNNPEEILKKTPEIRKKLLLLKYKR